MKHFFTSSVPNSNINHTPRVNFYVNAAQKSRQIHGKKIKIMAVNSGMKHKFERMLEVIIGLVLHFVFYFVFNFSTEYNLRYIIHHLMSNKC